jgi:hypothetical protein
MSLRPKNLSNVSLGTSTRASDDCWCVLSECGVEVTITDDGDDGVKIVLGWSGCDTLAVDCDDGRGTTVTWLVAALRGGIVSITMPAVSFQNPHISQCRFSTYVQ